MSTRILYSQATQTGKSLAQSVNDILTALASSRRVKKLLDAASSGNDWAAVAAEVGGGLTPQQAQEVQGRLQQMQQELENKTVSASSGGGMVTAIADGKGQVRSVRIDPSVVNPSDVEMLEDLVLAAVSEAQKKAAALAQEEMKRLTGGLSLPFKLPF